MTRHMVAGLWGKGIFGGEICFFHSSWKSGGVQDLSRVFLHEKNGMQEIYFNSKPVQCDIFLYLFHLYVASVRMAT